MKYLGAAPTIGLVLLLTGCLYIPPLGRQIGEHRLQPLKVGSTTREQVLQLLGKPNVLHNERFFVYEGRRHFGHLIVGGGYYAESVPIGESHSNIRIEFDETGVVKSHAIETSGRCASARPAHRLMKSRSSAYDRVLSVAFSPDGKWLAAGKSDNRVIVWNLETGQKEAVFRGEKRCWWVPCFVGSVAFAPDGKTLAAAGIDKRLVLWDVATWKQLVTLEGHVGRLQLAFSPDGKTVATGDLQGALKVSDAVTGREVISLKGHTSAITDVAYSPDGKTLVTSSSDKTVRLWDPVAGKQLVRLDRDIPLQSVGYSPDGALLAVGSRFHMELWKVRPKPEPTSFNDTKGKAASSAPLGDILAVFILPGTLGHFFVGESVAFSPDGQQLAAIAGGAAIWDVATSRKLACFDPQGGYSFSELAFSPDGTTLATAGTDGVNLWNVELWLPADRVRTEKGAMQERAEETRKASLEERLKELEDLKARETITDEEYAILRRRVIETFR